MTRVLIRDTESDVEEKVTRRLEQGMERCSHKPRRARSPQKLEEAGALLPESRGWEGGPAHASILVFWPPEL